MVNNNLLRLLPSGTCVLENGNNGRILIGNGPVYCLRTAQSQLTLDNLRVLNVNALQHKELSFLPELSDEELLDFILALNPTDHVGSERCSTSINRVVDCDGYAMKWNRKLRQRWEHGAKIYVKFGYMENISKCLIISIHPSKLP
ncbi:hypothetical protein [Janthinobacterium sp. LB3P118]|uniref:hypothetical protein n=1 Tax=Janthinobacterium sp. LB3P118 TaxID=3424195 RepID=UPI003F2385C9